MFCQHNSNIWKYYLLCFVWKKENKQNSMDLPSWHTHCVCENLGLTRKNIFLERD